ncbi:MAG: hypothetical protein ACTHM1_12535, partial [Solirubrobacteraceae bacterium]
AEETNILEQNVQSGTAIRSAINCPTAAKTGTTSNLVDAWLDGYTPNYSTSAWMGYPKSLVPMTDVHGEPQQGGYLPAEIWHTYMAAVTESQPCAQFEKAKEEISYSPFYGKFASTGASSSTSSSAEESSGATSTEHHSSEHGEAPAGAHHVTPQSHAPPPEPHAPAPATEPPAPPSGGAGPHGPAAGGVAPPGH